MVAFPETSLTVWTAGPPPVDEPRPARRVRHHLPLRPGRAPAAGRRGTRRSRASPGGSFRCPAGPGAGAEILVYENLLPGFQQGRGILPRLAATLFNRGRIHRLRWKEGAFVRIWQSGITEGYIADFGYGDLDEDGLAEVVVGVVPRGFDPDTLNPFGRPRGRIMAYELPWSWFDPAGAQRPS